jgi:hypothetical protein
MYFTVCLIQTKSYKISDIGVYFYIYIFSPVICLIWSWILLVISDRVVWSLLQDAAPKKVYYAGAKKEDKQLHWSREWKQFLSMFVLIQHCSIALIYYFKYYLSRIYTLFNWVITTWLPEAQIIITEQCSLECKHHMHFDLPKTGNWESTKYK